MIIFATPTNISLLKQSDEWYMDGTFKTCPSLFYQLYSIHAKLSCGKSVALVYALLPSKSSLTYRTLLRRLADVLDGYSPRLIHVDFELAVITELTRIFPNVNILGCSFHFNQSIYRRIQSETELLLAYRNDLDFALKLRKFPALAYVPIQDVASGFNRLLSSPFVRQNEDILSEFINYFESQWVGRSRNPPRFQIEWWNVFETTLEGVGRTNDHMEGWHSAFSGRVNCRNPSFHKLVEHLKAEQGLTEYVVTNVAARGGGSIPTKRKFLKRQKRLYEIVSRYGNGDLIAYLLDVAHSISF